MSVVIRNRYRIASGLLLGTVALMVVFAAFRASPQAAPPDPSGEPVWDPCRMIVEYGPMHNLMSAVVIGSLLVLGVQGLRNRPGLRWLAIAGLLGLILVLQDSEDQGCSETPLGILSFICLGSIALLFIINAFQPRRKAPDQYQRTHASMARQGVIAVFVILIGVWFTCYQVATILAHKDPDRAIALISGVQRKISLPALLLLLLAGAASLYEYVSRRGVQPKI